MQSAYMNSKINDFSLLTESLIHSLIFQQYNTNGVLLLKIMKYPKRTANKPCTLFNHLLLYTQNMLHIY